MLLEGYLKNYATGIFHKKMRTDFNFRDQALEETNHKVLGQGCLPHKYHAPEDSGNLKNPKNVKSISNTTVYHLVSCRVIPRPATMKG